MLITITLFRGTPSEVFYQVTGDVSIVSERNGTALTIDVSHPVQPARGVQTVTFNSTGARTSSVDSARVGLARPRIVQFNDHTEVTFTGTGFTTNQPF